MKQTRVSSKSGARGAAKSRNGNSLSHPPQLDGVQLKHGVALRFTSGAAGTTSVTFQNLLDTYLVATSATAVANVFQTVKIRCVEAWALPVIGGASTITLEYSGTTGSILGDQQTHMDTSMGVSPAHVKARPSVRCLAANYQIANAGTAFLIIAPAGTVVDVHLTFRGQFAGTLAAQNASVGATAGCFYLRGLDGLAAATTNWTPQPAYAII